MYTTPEQADAMTKSQLYARLIEVENDRENLRLHIHETSGKAAMDRQAEIVAKLHTPEAFAV